MSEHMVLVGRVAAVQDPDDKAFSLLLHGAEAAPLLKKIPPAELWGDMPEGAITVNGAALQQGEARRNYRLPYDLLVPPSAAARLIATGRAAGGEAVCSAHISYPPRKRGRKVTAAEADEWQAHWRAAVAAAAGRWARVRVRPQRYSFAAHGAQQVGTRLELQDVEECACPRAIE